MSASLQAFKSRVLGELLPQFCNHPTRRCSSGGFKADWGRVSEADARDFLRALDANLIQHVGRGQYIAARSAAKEQFFWHGQKNIDPQPVYLWVEPVITVAAVARLHFEYDWPIELIGTQSVDWAFDLVTYNRHDKVHELIACEVKKSTTELDKLVMFMRKFAADGASSQSFLRRNEKNALNKLNALRNRKIPIFWALGPDRANYVFRMSYGDDGHATFNPSSENVLIYYESPALSDEIFLS